MTRVHPGWPGRPYMLACPPRTTQQECDLLGTGGSFISRKCYEPEQDTHEVINSLLLGCDGRGGGASGGGGSADVPANPCLYVDVGCNVGYFAAHAAALGAAVDCFEPTPFYVDAARQTFRENAFGLRQSESGRHTTRSARHNVSQLAVVSELMLKQLKAAAGPSPQQHVAAAPLTQHFKGTYTPCGVGERDAHQYGTSDPDTGRFRHGWDAPLGAIRTILLGRHVTLLKIDIDSHDGGLLHDTVRMLLAKQTSIDSILIELGDPSAYWAACDNEWNRANLTICVGTPPRHPKREPTRPVPHPRGGEVSDLLTLQETLGYDVYRVNVHTNREIYSWRGENLNGRMSPPQPGWEPLHFVRSMRKLERLKRKIAPTALPTLLRMHQSLLITRERLASPVRHHKVDLEAGAATPDGVKLSMERLNEGNPSIHAALSLHSGEQGRPMADEGGL